MTQETFTPTEALEREVITLNRAVNTLRKAERLRAMLQKDSRYGDLLLPLNLKDADEKKKWYLLRKKLLDQYGSNPSESKEKSTSKAVLAIKLLFMGAGQLPIKSEGGEGEEKITAEQYFLENVYTGLDDSTEAEVTTFLGGSGLDLLFKGKYAPVLAVPGDAIDAFLAKQKRN